MLFTIPANSDICKFLNQIGAIDVVLATSETDFCNSNPCVIGQKIASRPQNTNSNYKPLVLNPTTNCINWTSQPALPTYDSALMNPWQESSFGSIGTSSPGSIIATLLLPTFTVNVKIVVFFNVLTQTPGAGYYPTFAWDAYGPEGTVVNKLNGYPGIVSYLGNDSTCFAKVVTATANTAGLYCRMVVGEQIDSSAVRIDGRINAIAFRA